MKYLVALIVMAASFPAVAVEWNTNCSEYAAFKYPCPTFSNPGRRCRGRDPIKYASCETARVVVTRVLNPFIAKVGKMVARDTTVVNAARSGGWTKNNCTTVGGGVILLASTFAQAPICAAATVGAPACLTFLAASSGVIAVATCTQLCHDGNLRGDGCE